MSKKIPSRRIREDYGWGLLDRLRLLFQKDKEMRRALRDIVGFFPHCIDYYRLAFAHSSSEYKNKSGKSLNNERLEFLGDAVLETVVSDIVFHHFDRQREGFLTSTRSKLVQRSTLNRLADEMGITRLVRFNHAQSTPHSNIGGNAFEALVGAIYLDRGYNHCFAFVTRCILGKYLNIERVAKKEENFKSRILEWCQKNKAEIEFRPKQTKTDRSNALAFQTQLFVEGIMIGSGSGFSKKESHQNASREALRRLQRNGKLRAAVLTEKEKRLRRAQAEGEDVQAENAATQTEPTAAQPPSTPSKDKNTTAQAGNKSSQAQRMPSQAQRTPSQVRNAPSQPETTAKPKRSTPPQEAKPHS